MTGNGDTPRDPPRVIGKAVDDAVLLLGPDASYDQVLEEIHPLHASRECVKRHLDRRFPGGVDRRPPDATPPADRVPPPPADCLSTFVKLACAVEAVGGVARARELLDLIEIIIGRRATPCAASSDSGSAFSPGPAEPGRGVRAVGGHGAARLARRCGRRPACTVGRAVQMRPLRQGVPGGGVT